VVSGQELSPNTVLVLVRVQGGCYTELKQLIVIVESLSNPRKQKEAEATKDIAKGKEHVMPGAVAALAKESTTEKGGFGELDIYQQNVVARETIKNA
jgi:hypothetical protein